MGIPAASRRPTRLDFGRVATVVACGLVAMACTSEADERNAEEAAAARGWNGGLVGTSWIASSIGGQAAFQDPESMIVFQSPTVLVGNGGCNTFSTTIGISGAQIIVGPLASTDRTCAPAVMSQEVAFFGAIQEARAFQSTGEILVLLGPSGERAAELTRVPEPL